MSPGCERGKGKINADRDEYSYNVYGVNFPSFITLSLFLFCLLGLLMYPLMKLIVDS